MRNIVVIGAGQAGLLLSLGLLQQGYKVTLVSDRTPEAILHGPVPAGAVVFGPGRAVERELKVNYWDDIAQDCQAVHIDIIAPSGAIALTFEAALNPPALCVDQRLKSYRWMQEVKNLGGQLVVKPATISDLEGYAKSAELVVVAAGKGEIAALFPKDPARSPHVSAPRHVSMIVVNGYKPWTNFHRPGPKFLILPGLGEIFSAPFYGKDNGQAIFLGYEAIPGGSLDRFTVGMSPQAQLDLSKQLFRELIPSDYDAIADVELIDPRAYLSGKIVPVVREPVGVLPSGAPILGLGDTVNLHDPIAAQGANNAAKAARIVTRRIVEHGDRPFDSAWMREVFSDIWAQAQYANLLADKMLAPPEPHVLELFGAAAQHPAVASRFVNGIANPTDLFPWLADPTATRQYLQSLA